jgi:hypothetical protein
MTSTSASAEVSRRRSLARRNAFELLLAIANVMETQSVGDPGDDTARRYRYQYEFTAALLCSLIEDDASDLEIFCEHHEDVVVRDATNKCCGVQIKTREQGLELWKATDEDLVAALAKFVRRDHAFPGEFTRFRLITNHQFWTARDNGKNVAHLLDLAKSTAGAPPTGILRAFARMLGKKANVSEDAVLCTLRKTKACHEAPKFRDSLLSVSEALRTTHPGCADVSATKLQEISRALRSAVFEAASLDHEQCLPAFLVLNPDPAQFEAKAKIEGKRFDKARVLDVIGKHLVPSGLVLLGNPDQMLPPASRPSATESILAKKLTAGDLSATTVHHALDCWASAAYQHLLWSSRLGAETALAQHGHVRTVVLAEAAAAFEETFDDARPFGRAMLKKLRLRIHQRRQTKTDLFRLDDEHLLGHAFMLTEECKVWWSKPFTP